MFDVKIIASYFLIDKSQVDACEQRTENESPNSRINDNNNYNNKAKTSAAPLPKSGLGMAGIIGIALCGVALLVLIVGIAVTCRYRKIAKEREKKYKQTKKSQVNSYLDSIPDTNDQTDSPISPQSSIGRSASSKDNIIPRTVTTRAQDYTQTNNGVGSNVHV